MSHRSPEDPGHYFSATQDSASRPSEVELALPDRTLRLATDRGVFSADRVDRGTKLLLVETAVQPEARGESWPEGDLVDLGCGYGPIALTMALRHPERTVWAVDTNERARRLCAANARIAGVGSRVRVVDPEEVPAELEVAALISNPPIRIGKEALHALLDQWLQRLLPRGEAWLVVQKHLGADSLAAWMAEEGWEVSRQAARSGYRLMRVTAGAPGRPAAAGDHSGG